MNIEPILKNIDNEKYVDGVGIKEILKNNSAPFMVFNGTRVKTLSKYLDNIFKKYYANTIYKW